MREVILEPASKIERKGFAADPPNETRVDVAHRPPDAFPADLAHRQLDAPTFALAQMAKPQRRVWLACSTVGPLAGSAARTGCLLRLQADLVLDRVPTVMKKFGLYLRLNRWRLCIAFSTC